MDATCQRRRRIYLRAGPWLADLRRLVTAGLPDGRTARELCRLYPGLTFSRRSVLYWRDCLRRLASDDKDGDPERAPAQARQTARLRHQMRAGWGHLLPAWDEHARCWTPGHELSPAEVRILSALRDHGPLVRRELAARLGLCGRNPVLRRGRSRLARLARKGLVVRERNRFRLAPAALPLY